MLGGKLRPALPFHVIGQSTHGVPGDFDSFATVKRSFRDIDSGKDCKATTLPLDPKRQCRLDCILGAFKTTAFNGLPDKILLLWGEVDLHILERTAHVS